MNTTHHRDATARASLAALLGAAHSLSPALGRYVRSEARRPIEYTAGWPALTRLVSFPRDLHALQDARVALAYACDPARIPGWHSSDALRATRPSLRDRKGAA